MTDRIPVIGMYSGGLDSILAAKLMVEEGFDVIALHFYNGFNDRLNREIATGPGRVWRPDDAVIESARRLGIDLVPIDCSHEFLDVLHNPKHGYGSALNPCIDCRIFFLSRARKLMEEYEAPLVFTGEVVGQRPMSQHKPMLRHVEKAAGLDGRLLRPLSAKLLDPTIPEREGIVNRDHLYGFKGRGRKPQQELAARFGINFYPQPGGGCILTDKTLYRKYRDLADHPAGTEPDSVALNSLKAGRHLRLPGGTKVIVGRTEVENRYLEDLLAGVTWIVTLADIASATVFAFGDPPEEDWRLIAGINARYSKALADQEVTVIAERNNERRTMTTIPVAHTEIEPLLII